MQQCVQVYLGLQFSEANINMLREIKNTEIEITRAFASKLLFTSSDIDLKNMFNYLNKKANIVVNLWRAKPCLRRHGSHKFTKFYLFTTLVLQVF